MKEMVVVYSGLVGVRLQVSDCNDEFSLKRMVEDDRFSIADDNM